METKQKKFVPYEIMELICKQVIKRNKDTEIQNMAQSCSLAYFIIKDLRIGFLDVLHIKMTDILMECI